VSKLEEVVVVLRKTIMSRGCHGLGVEVVTGR